MEADNDRTIAEDAREVKDTKMFELDDTENPLNEHYEDGDNTTGWVCKSFQDENGEWYIDLSDQPE